MVRSNKRSKKMKWGGDPSDSGATTNEYSSNPPVGIPPNPPNPPVGVTPPAEEKGFFDKVTGFFSSDKSPDDLAKEMKEAQDQIDKYNAVLSELKQKQATQVKTGGRRRSRRTKRSNKKRTNKRRHR